MEYDEDNGVAGSIPEFGAIFMSNILTKKECFKRKIFALPSSQAEFVKQVKAGMVLFLFEFKKRQLFGVYQASSDGAMDIMPHAFNYSGRRFPAQVCFTPIWCCDPLSEREFQDAIIENYFSAKKFTFGLSEDQVRRLLFLFSSRKMKKEMVPQLPQPLAEAVVGVAGKYRRSVGDDRFELSERGYTELTENDEFNPAAFSNYHVNSLVKEDEVLIDDRVNKEGKVYPLVQGDFLAKRRRIDNDDWLLENDMADIYNYGALQTFHIDYPRDTLDEVRNLAAVRQLLAVERVRKQNQVDKIRNAVLSSESVMDPLDVRTADDDRFMQRNRLFDEYNMDNVFMSERYEKPLDTNRFLFDDCVQRNQNIHDIVKPTLYGDGNLTLCRQTMQVIEDHQCSMNRQLENRCHLDRNVSSFSAFEHNASLLHETRETSSGGRFPINDRIDSEPNFGSCDVEDLSSAKFSRPLHYGHRIIHDRKYPIVEGRVTENMVGGTFCSATSTRNAGYFESVGGRVVDDGSFRKSEGVDNEKDIHTHIGPGVSLGCPSSFCQKWSLPSFSDKLLPEKGLSQLNVAHNFGSSRATFDDATITRSTPYIPEHPNFSHGFNASMAAKQNSSLVRENPHHGSQEDFYSYKNRSSPYALESKKSSRSLDIAPEFGNKGLPTNISGHRSPLRHETTSSFLNSDLSMHADQNTSVPVNDRGSLFSKSFLARPATDHEKIEGGGAFFPSKSSGNNFESDENFPIASQHMSKHVPRQEMDMLAGKDFICSEAKNSSLGIYRSERDLTGNENQYFGISSNMNCPVNHEISETPHFGSNVNRKSVFSRLTSREEFQGAEDRNESGFDCHDCYMDATADEVMDMLRQSNNLSLTKLKKFRVVGQPKHGESAFGEKQARSHIEIKSSSMEKKLKDAHLAIEESIDQVPKETRIMDFKRRSDTKKNLVGASTDSVTCNKTNIANEEVGNPTKATLKRKKLVRPVFGKAESATDTICSSQNSRVPGQILESDDNTSLNNVLVSRTHQSMDCVIKEHSKPEEQKDIGVHVLPSSSNEDDDKRNCEKDVSICAAELANDNTRLNKVLVSRTHQSIDCNIKQHLKPEEQKDIIGVHVLPSSINEDDDKFQPDNTRLNNVLVSRTHQSMDCNIKKHSKPEEQKDIVGVHGLPSSSTKPEEENDIGAHVLPSSSNELKDHKTSIVGLHIDSSQALLTEITLHKGVGIQTSVEDILYKNVDSMASSLNLEESSSVGLELGAGCLNNPIEEKGPRMVKRKKKILKKVVKKNNKTGSPALQDSLPSMKFVTI